MIRESNPVKLPAGTGDSGNLRVHPRRRFDAKPYYISADYAMVKKALERKMTLRWPGEMLSMEDAPRCGRAILILTEENGFLWALRWGVPEQPDGPEDMGERWFWADYSDDLGCSDSDFSGWYDLPEEVVMAFIAK